MYVALCSITICVIVETVFLIVLQFGTQALLNMLIFNFHRMSVSLRLLLEY